MIKNIIEIGLKSGLINYLDLKRDLSTIKCELTRNSCNLCQLYDFNKKYCKYQYLEHVCYTVDDLILLVYLFAKKDKEEFILRLKTTHPQVNIDEVFTDLNDINDDVIKQYITNELKKFFNIDFQEDFVEEETKDKENETINSIVNNTLSNNNTKHKNEVENLLTSIKKILLKSKKLKLYDINSEEYKRIKKILSLNTTGQVIIKFSEKGFDNITKEDIDEVFSISTYIDIIKDFLYEKNKEITKEDVLKVIDYVCNYKEYNNINHFPYTYELTNEDIAKILEAHSYIKSEENVFKWNEQRVKEYVSEFDIFKKLTISHNFLYLLRKFKSEVVNHKSKIIKGFILYELLQEISIYMMSRIIFVSVDKKKYFKNFIENLLIEFYDFFIKPYTIYIINESKLYKSELYKSESENVEGIGIVQIDSKIVEEIEKENLYDEKIILL